MDFTPQQKKIVDDLWSTTHVLSENVKSDRSEAFIVALLSEIDRLVEALWDALDYEDVPEADKTAPEYPNENTGPAYHDEREALWAGLSSFVDGLLGDAIYDMAAVSRDDLDKLSDLIDGVYKYESDHKQLVFVPPPPAERVSQRWDIPLWDPPVYENNSPPKANSFIPFDVPQEVTDFQAKLNSDIAEYLKSFDPIVVVPTKPVTIFGDSPAVTGTSSVGSLSSPLDSSVDEEDEEIPASIVATIENLTHALLGNRLVEAQDETDFWGSFFDDEDEDDYDEYDDDDDDDDNEDLDVMTKLAEFRGVVLAAFLQSFVDSGHNLQVDNIAREMMLNILAAEYLKHLLGK